MEHLLPQGFEGVVQFFECCEVKQDSYRIRWQSRRTNFFQYVVSGYNNEAHYTSYSYSYTSTYTSGDQSGLTSSSTVTSEDASTSPIVYDANEVPENLAALKLASISGDYSSVYTANYASGNTSTTESDYSLTVFNKRTLSQIDSDSEASFSSSSTSGSSTTTINATSTLEAPLTADAVYSALESALGDATWKAGGGGSSSINGGVGSLAQQRYSVGLSRQAIHATERLEVDVSFGVRASDGSEIATEETLIWEGAGDTEVDSDDHYTAWVELPPLTLEEIEDGASTFFRVLRYRTYDGAPWIEVSS